MQLQWFIVHQYTRFDNYYTMHQKYTSKSHLGSLISKIPYTVFNVIRALPLISAPTPFSDIFRLEQRLKFYDFRDS